MRLIIAEALSFVTCRLLTLHLNLLTIWKLLLLTRIVGIEGFIIRPAISVPTHDRCGSNTLLLDKFRIEEHKALVDDLQGASQLLVILIEFDKDLIRLSLWQLDQEAFISFDVKGCNEQILLIG